MMPQLRRLGAMNRSYRRTRLRLLAGVSGAVTLSLLAVAGCSSSPSSSAPTTSSSAAATGVRLASLTDGSPHLTGRVADVGFRGRGYIIDPFGHGWAVASHVEDVTQEEMMRRAAELFG
jgi:hypothetical protein